MGDRWAELDVARDDLLEWLAVYFADECGNDDDSPAQRYLTALDRARS
jgi:hypothetical protein